MPCLCNFVSLYVSYNSKSNYSGSTYLKVLNFGIDEPEIKKVVPMNKTCFPQLLKS